MEDDAVRAKLFNAETEDVVIEEVEEYDRPAYILIF